VGADLVGTLEAIQPYDWRRAAVRELALHVARTVPNLARRSTLPVDELRCLRRAAERGGGSRQQERDAVCANLA